MKGTSALIIVATLTIAGGCGSTPTTPTGTPPSAAAATLISSPATWATTPVTVTHEPPVPPVPVISGIRYAAHKDAGYDRIVLDIPGALPGYSAKYVTEVRRDGSGELVSIPGEAFLLIVLHPAQAHRDDGTPTVTGVHRTGLTGIKAYAMAGDYEGYVSIALGLSAVSKYHVDELTDRIYIDVAT